MTDYQQFEAAVAENFHSKKKGRPVFKVPALDLWSLYLNNLPVGIRQEHTCRSCQHFFERFGGLVVVESSLSRMVHYLPRSGLRRFPSLIREPQQSCDAPSRPVASKTSF